LKSVVIFGAATPVLLLACSLSAAQPATTGAEAARQIDWKTLGPGSPIPGQMPATESDDPLEVGFTRQWLYRAVTPQPPNTDRWKDLALEIVSKHRNLDDQWASRMEKELRELIQEKIPRGRNSRVFCNSFGCLCYVEREESKTPSLIVYSELVGKTGRNLGLRPSDVDAIFGYLLPQWELTIVKRSVPDSSDVSSGTRIHVP